MNEVVVVVMKSLPGWKAVVLLGNDETLLPWLFFWKEGVHARNKFLRCHSASGGGGRRCSSSQGNESPEETSITHHVTMDSSLPLWVCLLLLNPWRTLGSDSLGPPDCHTTLTHPQGSFSSPGYPKHSYSPGLKCSYAILTSAPSPPCGIRLTIETLELAPPDKKDGFCKDEWLSVDSCVPEGGSRFCGSLAQSTSYEYPFQRDASAFRLTFVSAPTATNRTGKIRGFHVRYRLLQECQGLYWDPPVSLIPGVEESDGSPSCFTHVTESRGTINTPYFPRHYPNNVDCVYEFLRESEDICGVRMRALTFDLEPSISTALGGACSDFFHVVGGCGFLCGNVKFLWIARFQPGATSLKFHFHSDERRSRPGFQIAFEQLSDCS